jgi:prepilin-type N-terminal cleavage/methylation domain-containing protein
MSRKGFTLIELMIVIAIIAIIAAIAIPGILAATRAANERNASGSLKQINSVEVTFKTSDFDQNAVNDYWVADMAGLYYTSVSGGGQIKMIELAVALADGDTITTYTGFTSSPKAGYWFVRMGQYSDGSTTPVTFHNPPSNTHTDRFAFFAYPNSYGSSGRLVFIVSEAGTMYKKDPGAAATFASTRASTGVNNTNTTYENNYGVFPSDPSSSTGGGASVGPWSKMD